MDVRTADRLARAIGGAATAFLTAAWLWLLLGRLGDAAGSRVAGWCAVLSAVLTIGVVAIAAVLMLRDAAQRSDSTR